MFKLKNLFFIVILITISLQPVTAVTEVFITSDYVILEGSHEYRVSETQAMLNDIKKYIEEESNGEIRVIVDPKAPSPGEQSRAANSRADVRVYLAAACSGTMVESARSASGSSSPIIYVNTGDVNLYDMNFLRRSWDDDWSSIYFSGLKKPAEFLDKSGIKLIQPKQYIKSDDKFLTKNDEKINKYIAHEIVKFVNSDYKSKNKVFDKSYIMNHEISPVELSKYSKMIVEDDSNSNKIKNSYGKYSSAEILHMSTAYVYGYPIRKPSGIKPPSNPLNESQGVKDTYSIEEYSKIAYITYSYMEENKRAPNYVDYNGARISYYDLVYNYASITSDIESKSDMNLPREVKFKSNQGLSEIFQYITLIVLMAIAFIVVRKAIIKKKR